MKTSTRLREIAERIHRAATAIDSPVLRKDAQYLRTLATKHAEAEYAIEKHGAGP